MLHSTPDHVQADVHARFHRTVHRNVPHDGRQLPSEPGEGPPTFGATERVANRLPHLFLLHDVGQHCYDAFRELSSVQSHVQPPVIHAC